MAKESNVFIVADSGIQLCWDGAITTPNDVLQADHAKAYIECSLCHTFPNFMKFGNTIHPQVLANSHRNALHQNVNIDHQVKAYDPESSARGDRIVGSIVYVEMIPQYATDRDGKLYQTWPVTYQPTPYMRLVLSIAKQANGVDRILGGHQSGKRTWSVSIEYLFDIQKSGFIVSNKIQDTSGLFNIANTPDDINKLGWVYIPYEKAPDDLRACWDEKKRRISKKWRGAETLLMQGGLNGEIYFMGVGLTTNPAEPTAKIDTVLASDQDIFEPIKIFEKIAQIV